MVSVYLPGDHSRTPPDIINIVIRLGQCTHSHHHHHQSQQNKVKRGTFLSPDICNYIRLLQNTFPQIRLYLLIIRRKNSFHKEGRIGLQVVQWWVRGAGGDCRSEESPPVSTQTQGQISRQPQLYVNMYINIAGAPLNDLRLSKPQPVFGQNY